MVLLLLIPLYCLGEDWKLTKRFVALAGPLTDELVSNLHLEGGHVREPTCCSRTTQTHYLCHWSTLSTLPPYFAQLYASGVTHFKIFLPWTHIIPEGDVQNPNATNVECYRQLLKTLRAANLKPVLILHQKHLPQSLDQSRTFTDLFAEYADFVFQSFGDLVDIWLTFSNLPGTAEGLPQDELLSPPLQALASAHRAAYKIYHEKYSSEGK